MGIKRRSFLKMIGIAGVPLGEKAKDSTAQYNPPHNSLQEARLNRMPERVYAEKWKIMNNRNIGYYDGYTAIELILAPNGEIGEIQPVSKRDAEVAACVIQWLGTNCGFHFMLDCEAKIKKAEKASVAPRKEKGV